MFKRFFFTPNQAIRSLDGRLADIRREVVDTWPRLLQDIRREAVNDAAQKVLCAVEHMRIVLAEPPLDEDDTLPLPVFDGVRDLAANLLADNEAVRRNMDYLPEDE